MSRVVLTTKHRYMEERAARWFTPANFYLLREEIKMMDSFQVVDTMMRGHPTFGKKVYTVGFKQRPGVVFFVVSSGNDVHCSCQKMEREGLPCRHILSVLHHTHTSQIPDCCKLRRMQRRGDIKAERLDEMKDLGSRVFDLASEDAQEFQEIKAFLEGWLDERRRDDGVLAKQGNDAVTTDSGGTLMTKKIKFFHD
ncbi:hypothetical protein PR202_ga12698 [Eleusine coracana subsp. coracana]|uniref:Protein FAR1-RELATED SEQUENCE n=1 Tax=Eleusine coracana subsp. coracana TaxID=191504 RepID=A0AAV5CCM1_ELECO|nr:hypothetical protein PR202_ga12698 [Eleusine coracana subsp. coracana]